MICEFLHNFNTFLHRPTQIKASTIHRGFYKRRLTWNKFNNFQESMNCARAVFVLVLIRFDTFFVANLNDKKAKMISWSFFLWIASLHLEHKEIESVVWPSVFILVTSKIFAFQRLKSKGHLVEFPLKENYEMKERSSIVVCWSWEAGFNFINMLIRAAFTNSDLKSAKKQSRHQYKKVHQLVVLLYFSGFVL